MVQEQIAAIASQVFAASEAAIGQFGATVALLSLGIAVYAAIVGTFYTYLSRRVLYHTEPEERSGISGAVHKFGNSAALLLKYTFLFPAITFLYFVLLSTALFLLSRTVELDTVFVLAISVVAAVRLLAYYKEEIAVDLAKMLPLALLGVLIVDPTLFSRELVQARVLELAGALPRFVPFIIIAVAIEWVLRIIYSLYSLVAGKKPAAEDDKASG